MPKSLARGIKRLLVMVGTDHVRLLFVDAISECHRSPDLIARPAGFERRKIALEAALAQDELLLPALHPNLAEVYGDEVTRLREALTEPDNTEVLEPARRLIDRIVIHPPNIDGDLPGIEIVGQLVAMLQAGGAGTPTREDRTQGRDVHSAFLSSLKMDQGAWLPGGGSRGKAPWPRLPFPYPCLTAGRR